MLDVQKVRTESVNNGQGFDSRTGGVKKETNDEDTGPLGQRDGAASHDFQRKSCLGSKRNRLRF